MSQSGLILIIKVICVMTLIVKVILTCRMLYILNFVARKDKPSCSGCLFLLLPIINLIQTVTVIEGYGVFIRYGRAVVNEFFTVLLFL